MTAHETALHNLHAIQTATFIFAAVLALDCLVRLGMLWNNLNHERGADRICWLLVLSIPIFGTIAFVFIALPQRDDRDNNGAGTTLKPRSPSPESLAWANEILKRP